ncbi:MAG: mechanosensitive ion channel domain-containing protein [Pseudomonadota bacterium]
MEGELSALLDSLGAFGTTLRNFAATLILPSRLLQLGVVVLCLILAWIAKGAISPRLEAWMRGLEGRPKWQLRFLLVLQRRMTLLLFAVFVWIAALVFAQIYAFPSRRYLLVLIATVATVWFLIRIIAQLVRNRFLRRIIIWGLSIYVLLYFFGLLDATSTALDSVAIEFGDFRLTLLALLKAVIVTGLLFSAAGLVTRTAAARLRQNPDISPSMQELTIKALQIALFSTAFFIGLNAVGFDLTGLAVLSGAIGVGIGFGLQKVVSNLVSGVIILLDKSIKPGDVISLGDTFGWIEQLSARYVSVVTRDGREYLIPNEDLITGQVVNWSFSDNFVRLDINFGTAYADDPHLVRKLAIDAAMSVDRVLSHKRPVCHIVGFGDSSVDYVLRFWIADPSLGLTNIRGNVFLALWDTFKEHDISIPFPQREVRMLEGDQLAMRPADTPG